MSGGGGGGQPKLPCGKDVTDHNGEGGEGGAGVIGQRGVGGGGVIPMQVDNMYTGWRAGAGGLSA